MKRCITCIIRFKKKFPFIRKDAQKDISQFFETFLKEKAYSNLDITLIHGDFGAANILWNPETSMISGIIDFGGSGLGDPAYDFGGILSSYGEDFFEMCINLRLSFLFEKFFYFLVNFLLERDSLVVKHLERSTYGFAFFVGDI